MKVTILSSLLVWVVGVSVYSQDIDSLNHPQFIYRGEEDKLKGKELGYFLGRQFSADDFKRLESDSAFVVMAVIKCQVDRTGNVQDIVPIINTSQALATAAISAIKRTNGHWHLPHGKNKGKSVPIIIPFLHVYEGAKYELGKNEFLQQYIRSGKYLKGWIRHYYKNYVHYEPIITVSYDTVYQP